MGLQKHQIALALIFLAVLGFRLFFVFKTPYFSYDSYFNINQIEHIRTTGVPSFEDPLSISTRTFFFLPLFHYILAFFTFFLPFSITLKIIPSIFISLLTIVVYLLSYEITKNKEAALFAAFISGFIPVLVQGTLNQITVYSLSLPFFFFTLYCLMKIDDEKFILLFIACLIILTLLHPSSILLVVGLIFYMIFIYFEKLNYKRAEPELIFFSTILVIWLAFIVFKKPLFVHGLSVIWQNLPAQIINNYFSDFSVLKAIYQIGILPFLFGIYVIYKYIFKEKRKSIYLFMSFALSVLFLLWFKLVKIETGLIFLGIILTILFAQSYKIFQLYLQKTVVAKYRTLILALFFVIVAVSTILPSLQYASAAINEAPSEAEVNALIWLKTAKQPGVVVAAPEAGYLVEALSGNPVVLDSNYLLVSNVNQRYEDIETIYTTSYETIAIRLLNKYEVKYILLTEKTKQEYGVEQPAYLSDIECFNPIYDRGIFIYESLCIIEER